MKIRALQAMTIRDPVSGELTAIGYGCIAEVDDELGASLIEDGIAEAYTLISPTGTVEISENGETDVTLYAKASVNVANVVLTYVPNGALGAVDAVAVTPGTEVTLSDGTGLTAPVGKSFAGWATTAGATEPNVTSPYTVTANIMLYAVWADLPPRLTNLAPLEGMTGSITPAFDPDTLTYTSTALGLMATAGSGVAIAFFKGETAKSSGTGSVTQLMNDGASAGSWTIEVGTGDLKTVYNLTVVTPEN